MEWTEEKVITLIDKYRENEVLWNVKLTDYRNKNKKNDAWERLATEMKCSRVEIEKKMKTLLAQFRRERQKAEKMKKSGTGTDEIYATTWFGFKAFSFLYDKNTPMETKDTLQEVSKHILKNIYRHHLIIRIINLHFVLPWDGAFVAKIICILFPNLLGMIG